MTCKKTDRSKSWGLVIPFWSRNPRPHPLLEPLLSVRLKHTSSAAVLQCSVLDVSWLLVRVNPVDVFFHCISGFDCSSTSGPDEVF